MLNKELSENGVLEHEEHLDRSAGIFKSCGNQK